MTDEQAKLIVTAITHIADNVLIGLFVIAAMIFLRTCVEN